MPSTAKAPLITLRRYRAANRAYLIDVILGEFIVGTIYEALPRSAVPYSWRIDLPGHTARRTRNAASLNLAIQAATEAIRRWIEQAGLASPSASPDERHTRAQEIFNQTIRDGKSVNEASEAAISYLNNSPARAADLPDEAA